MFSTLLFPGSLLSYLSKILRLLQKNPLGSFVNNAFLFPDHLSLNLLITQELQVAKHLYFWENSYWLVTLNSRHTFEIISSLSHIALLLKRVEDRPEDHMEIDLIFILRVHEEKLVPFMVWNIVFWIPWNSALKFPHGHARNSIKNFLQKNLFQPRSC